jgi:ribosomal protein S14
MKLSPERAAEVKRRALAGESRSALAREFGICRQLVRAIAQGVRKV